jgi:hypothetical protein
LYAKQRANELIVHRSQPSLPYQVLSDSWGVIVLSDKLIQTMVCHHHHGLEKKKKGKAYSHARLLGCLRGSQS